MTYRHEQTGRGVFVAMVLGGAIAAAFALWFALAGAPAPLTVWMVCVCALTVASAMAMSRMRVAVDADRAGRVSWSMTFGWPGGTIPIAQIAEATIVPVTFWSGVGIHLTLRGWVWNVALGSGVQIRKHDGGAIVLGTDDARGLLAAIELASSG